MDIMGICLINPFNIIILLVSEITNEMIVMNLNQKFMNCSDSYLHICFIIGLPVRSSISVFVSISDLFFPGMGTRRGMIDGTATAPAAMVTHQLLHLTRKQEKKNSSLTLKNNFVNNMFLNVHPIMESYIS